MIYTDENGNPIGEGVGEVRGWIEATGYSGRLLTTGFSGNSSDVTQSFAEAWAEAIDYDLYPGADDSHRLARDYPFISKYAGRYMETLWHEAWGGGP